MSESTTSRGRHLGSFLIGYCCLYRNCQTLSTLSVECERDLHAGRLDFRHSRQEFEFNKNLRCNRKFSTPTVLFKADDELSAKQFFRGTMVLRAADVVRPAVVLHGQDLRDYNY